MTLKYGLIGSGMMGHEHIRNVALLPGVEVAAVADPNAKMRQSAAALAHGATQYDTHQQMLAAEHLDAVIIAAPNYLHHRILQDVLTTDLPILCEKPLGISLMECQDIAGQSAARQAPVWVAMEYRYMPPVARLIRDSHDGAVGPARMLAIREHRFPFLEKVGDWNRFSARTGGTMVEKCCHFFDLMRLILKAEPTRVYASGAMDVNHQDERYDGQKPDIIDNAFVTVDFDTGSRAMLDLCMFAEGSYWQEVISVTGPKARITAMIPGPARFDPDGTERLSRIVRSDRTTKREIAEDSHVDPAGLAAGDHHGSTFYQHQKFAEMVRSKGTPDVTVQDALISVAVGEAAERSAKTGEVVALCPTDLKG